MKFALSFAICCVLTTSLQADLFYSKPETVRFPRRVDLHEVDRINEEEKQREISNSVENNCGGNQQNETVRPVVSPSILMSTFQLIYKKTGIFPDKCHENRRVAIKSVTTGNCLDLKGAIDQTKKNTEVIQWSCHSTENQLIFLDHVGEGYVSLRFAPNYCIGIGYDTWASAFVSSSDEWCKSSPSHQWAIVQKGNHVIFQQRETGRCLSASDNGSVGNGDCADDDQQQKFKICERSGHICWP